MEERPITLRCARVVFTLRFLGTGVVSRYWPNTIRGGFGMALREMSCAMKRETCEGCALRRECAYGYLFETPIVDSDAVMRKYTNAPHPFVIEGAPRSYPVVKTGQQGEISVVLLGQAHRFLPYVFLAFQRLGRRGLGRDSVPFEVVRARDEGGRTLYEEGDRTATLEELEPLLLCLEPGPSRYGRFALDFITPLRLQAGGQIARRPDVPGFVAALARRVFLLRYFHEQHEDKELASWYMPVADLTRVIHADLRWEDMSRMSTRQQREVPLGGLMGTLECEGDVGYLEPLLRAGEYAHVGKNATFGLGGYRLRVGDQP